MEAYRKIQASRQKKKTPTKKEKDAAWKALKERESIVKQLEGMTWILETGAPMLGAGNTGACRGVFMGSKIQVWTVLPM